MTNQRNVMHQRWPSTAPRRGVAMLLVIMSLMIASTLTLSYLASRDNSALIGQNVTTAAQARWTADAGIEVAAAILETDVDWRSEHDNGRIASDFPLGAGTLTIEVRDIETGDLPNENTTHVEITSTATVGNIQQSSSAIASVVDADDGSVDVDLSEFAIFSDDEIDIGDQTTLTRWSGAPLASLGRRVKLGTRSSRAMSVQIGQQAAAIDATLFYAQGSSGGLLYSQQEQPIALSSLKDTIPMPPAPDPGVVVPTEGEGAENVTISSFWYRQEPPRRTLDLELRRFARGKLVAGTYAIANDLLLKAGSHLLIKGEVTLIVFGKITTRFSAIELAPGASLRVFVGKGASFHNSFVGQRRFNDIFDITGSAAWMDPHRIKFFSLPNAHMGEIWKVTGLSVIKASVYAPGAPFEMYGYSALYGRLAASRVKLRNHASIFYDHSLDQGCGYTTPTSPLFDALGHILPDFCNLATIESVPTPEVTTDSESTNGPSTDGGYAAPTPRPNEVDYQLVVYGTEVTTWEEAP